MHPFSSVFKRLHLKGLAFNRNEVAHVQGMTPARFDVLHLARITEYTALEACGARGIGINQREIQARLGLHRSTISKILIRLEKMGWIVRRRQADDRRMKHVRLTPRGRRMIWRAMRWIWRGRPILTAYEAFFRRAMPREHVLTSQDRFFDVLRSLAKHFGDRTTPQYEFGTVLD